VQAGPAIRCASTTSTQNSGLFDFLLPLFEKDSGIRVQVIAVGTGRPWSSASGATWMWSSFAPDGGRILEEGEARAFFAGPRNDLALPGRGDRL
jgi:hypothetical protein